MNSLLTLSCSKKNWIFEDILQSWGSYYLEYSNLQVQQWK